jgi:segregation and condensation protein B
MSHAPEMPDDQGVSLRALSEAFAQAMENRPRMSRQEPEDEPSGTAEAVVDGESVEETWGATPEEAAPLEVAESPDDDCPIGPATILEAMLFVGDRGNDPLTAAQAAELMRGVDPGEIPGLVEALNRRYEASGCPYRVVSEGAGYRLALAPAYHPLRDRFYGRAREVKLSQAAIDVLAIVAYQQPLSADEVARLRGLPSNQILSQLVRRQLLRIERTSEKPRVARYCTTARFLELFGLESLEDLPQSEELDRR